MPRKAAWPSETWPVKPVRIIRPRPTTDRMKTLEISPSQKSSSTKGAAFDADRIAALDSAYIRLRELTLIAYYLSEPGATQELRYELIPGVWEADIALGEIGRAHG